MEKDYNQFTVSITFENLDLFAFNNLAKAWQVDFLKIEKGRFASTLFQVIDPEFQIGHVKFNLGVKQEGTSPPGVWTFAFVIGEPTYWRNYVVQAESVIIYAPDSEINAVSSANFEVVVFSIPEKQLIKIANKSNLSGFLQKLRDDELLKSHGKEWGKIRKRLLKEMKILTSAKNLSLLNESKHFLKNKLSYQLVHLMSKLKKSTLKVSNKSRLKLLSEVERFMLNNMTEHIALKDIVDHVQRSERTLLYAFKKRFGISPMAYFKILKLNRVYHALREGIEEKPIAKLARESGFWHMGQFSKDYKKFYGELPSETIKKSVVNL